MRRLDAHDSLGVPCQAVRRQAASALVERPKHFLRALLRPRVLQLQVRRRASLTHGLWVRHRVLRSRLGVESSHAQHSRHGVLEPFVSFSDLADASCQRGLAVRLRRDDPRLFALAHLGHYQSLSQERLLLPVRCLCPHHRPLDFIELHVNLARQHDPRARCIRRVDLLGRARHQYTAGIRPHEAGSRHADGVGLEGLVSSEDLLEALVELLLVLDVQLVAVAPSDLDRAEPPLQVAERVPTWLFVSLTLD